MTSWADTPAGAIARLDASLARRGEDVVLRRSVGTTNQAVIIDVTVRALLRGYQPSELVGQITQQDQAFTLSPTEIDRSQWPGASVPPVGPATDPRVPRQNDALLTSRGRLTVQAAAGIYVANVLVRIEGRARGS